MWDTRPTLMRLVRKHRSRTMGFQLVCCVRCCSVLIVDGSGQIEQLSEEKTKQVMVKKSKMNTNRIMKAMEERIADCLFNRMFQDSGEDDEDSERPRYRQDRGDSRKHRRRSECRSPNAKTKSKT